MKKSIFTSSIIMLLAFIISSNCFGDDKGIGISDSGFGDVLLAPLYDVRNLVNPGTPEGTTLPTTQQTLITIVNTDPTYGVIARIKFMEWKRGRDVLYFDIPLSPNGVWVGEVSKLPSGGAVINSSDRFVSNIPATFDTPFTTSIFPAGGIAFLTYVIETSEPNPIERTEYGNFEVIGEEKVGAMTSSGTFPRLAAGINRDVENVLRGTVQIIRPEVGISHQYNMTAIANFAIDPLGIWEPQYTAFPNLLNDVQGEGLNPGSGGFNQLEAILSKREVNFQYSTGIDPADPTLTPMNTSVIITFPTKHFHYKMTPPFSILGSAYPYGTPFTGARETFGDHSLNPSQSTPDCGEVISYTIWNGSEKALTSSNLLVPRLFWEVNLIGLYAQDPLPTLPIFRNNMAIPTVNTSTGEPFYSGRGTIDLSPNLLGGNDTRTYVQGEEGILFSFLGNLYSAYHGLPAIGVVMTEFFNDSSKSYYGNTAPWQYSTDWRASSTPTHVLQVNSSDPGVYITVSQADNSGQKDGTAPFTRIYNQGTTVTLTAPSTYNGKSFSNWSGADSISGTQTTVTMNGPKTVTVYFAATPPGTVTRNLPDCYTPSVPVSVSIRVTPCATTNSYAVEDIPPSGWTVSSINENGQWDNANKKVKWGPFFDHNTRTLTYQVTPPVGETGSKIFSGAASFDGTSAAMGGELSIDKCTCTFHPADTNHDSRISMDECTGYGSAWKTGQIWPTPPNPIPIEYVTNAGYLWRMGEVYHCDLTSMPPWVPGTGAGGGQFQAGRTSLKVSPIALGMGSAIRDLPNTYVPSVAVPASISVTPDSATFVYAVEDMPPVGWVVSSINENGQWDNTNKRVKWGPFFDANPRTLSYQATPPSGETGVKIFSGTASFDGTNVTISGDSTIASLGSSPRCDFNGDGKPDILWRNKGTGQNVVWLMNGTTYSSYAEAPTGN